MNDSAAPRLGFCCAYTPLPRIGAAGFVPYRILPASDTPEEAANLLEERWPCASSESTSGA